MNINLGAFNNDLEQLEEFKKRRDKLEYMGEGGLVPITGKQRSCIFGILKTLGKDAEDYGVTSVSDMTLAEAGDLIDQLVQDQEDMNYYNQGGYNRSLF